MLSSVFDSVHFSQILITCRFFFASWVLYTTRIDPRPQMIPQIDLNKTRNDPRPQMIPKFFHTLPEMIPEEL